MKTAIAIRNLISIERETIRLNQTSNVKLCKKSGKRIVFLRSILMYLETNTREAFVISEKERVKEIIKNKEYQYKDWLNDVCLRQLSNRQLKALFNKENGIPLLKKQLITLNFILS